MFDALFKEHLDCFNRLNSLKEQITDAGKDLGETLKKGKKILICGNGGSASDAQHFAAEIVGRFMRERKGWPAIALTTDTSIMSAIANDYGFETVFQRQVEAHGQPGDALIGLSTSGNSLNVINAVNKARELGIHTIGLLGGNGGDLRQTVHSAIVVPAVKTARIQEAHIFILHFWAEMIENMMMGEMG